MKTILVPREARSRLGDGALLQSYRAQRDDASFAELVARHGPMVYGVCLRMLGRRQDAEDAFQVVFLQLARNADRLKEGDLGGWLHTTARRVSLTSIRDRRRRRWSFGKQEPQSAVRKTEEVDVDLDSALATLPDQERSAIILCHLEGLSRSEAAEALGCPEGTLSARLSRGLEKLRGKLGKPPVAVLVAASLVILPDKLRANTVELLPHLRDGAIRDWAPPQVLNLYRRTTPMHLLDRLGPLKIALLASAFILIGAATGWRLISAQAPRDLGGLSATAAGTLEGSPSTGPAAANRPVRATLDGKKLAEAIKDFNLQASKDPIGRDQPKLTEEEIVAAIGAWATCVGDDAPKAPPEEYRKVAETLSLPKGAVIDSTNKLLQSRRGQSIDVWWIHLRIPQQPGGALPTYSLRVRMQQIRSRPMTGEEALYAAALEPTEKVAYPLKKASAPILVESLNRLMGTASGRPPDVFISAEASTNAVIVVASRARHTEIAKALKALDVPSK
jgi:RNA polymerase sigma factor (sigma-70 family)